MHLRYNIATAGLFAALVSSCQQNPRDPVATESRSAALEDNAPDPCSAKSMCDQVCMSNASCDAVCFYVSRDDQGNESCLQTTCRAAGNNTAVSLPCGSADPEPKYPPPPGVSSSAGGGFPVGCAPGPFGVSFYADPDFRGACKMVTLAWPDDRSGNVGDIGFPNDALSAIWVGSKVSAQLYFHENQNTILADIRPGRALARLQPGFDNQMTSFRIRIEDDPVAVKNRSFERPQLPAGTFRYQPTVEETSWNFGTTSGISGNGSAFTSGNPIAPVGSQVGILQGPVEIWQTVERFEMGKRYTVLFEAAQRGNFSQSPQSIRILLGNVDLGVITPVGTSYFTYFSNQFTATSTRHVLKLVGTVNADSTAFVDRVRVLGPF